MPLASTKIQINCQKASLSIRKQGECVSKTKIIINIKWIFIKMQVLHHSCFCAAENEFHSCMSMEQSGIVFSLRTHCIQWKGLACSSNKNPVRILWNVCDPASAAALLRTWSCNVQRHIPIAQIWFTLCKSTQLYSGDKYKAGRRSAHGWVNH